MGDIQVTYEQMEILTNLVSTMEQLIFAIMFLIFVCLGSYLANIFLEHWRSI